MKRCINCPYQSDIYSMLTGKELEMLETHRFEVDYAPGELVIKQGTVCTHVISFVSGVAKMIIETPGAGDLIIRMVKSQEFITSNSLLPNEKHRYSIVAVEPSRACLIDAKVIRQLVEQNSKFAVSLLKHLQQNMTFTQDRLLSFYMKHHIGRLAESILYLSEEVYGKNPFDLSLSKKEIAGLAGISRENTQRLLKSLDRDGIIHINKKTIEIFDKEKLRQISTNG
jgi:CRP-like cAMP-binding protein